MPMSRSEAARARWAKLTPEERRERTRKGREAVTPEQRRANLEKAHQAGKARWANMTPEQRSEIARRAIVARWENVTDPDERKAATHKARVASSAKAVAKYWAELSDDQRAALSEAMARDGGPQ